MKNKKEPPESYSRNSVVWIKADILFVTEKNR